MIDRTTVRLPRDLMTRAKRKAAAEGRTLTSLLEDTLRRALDEDGRDGKKRRVIPRVCKATGWLKPGIDLSRLEEEEDLERLVRGRK